MRRFRLPSSIPLLVLLAGPVVPTRQEAPRAAVQRESARVAAGAKPARSPLSGQSPFYGYTWVFYADLLAGVLAGLVAVQLRHRDERTGVRVAWSVVGVLLGAGSALAVFLPLFVLNAMFSIGFSPMPPVLMFGLSLGVILIAAGGFAISRRRG